MPVLKFMLILILSLIVQIIILKLGSLLSEYKIVKKPKDSTPSDYIMD